jgi:hypothetical protein
MRISIEVGIDDMQRELGYQDAPALEKMLIDQIMVSWNHRSYNARTFCHEGWFYLANGSRVI